MAVYVDNATNPLGRKKMSHMLADSESELHANYDVCQSKRKLAVARGAVQIGRRELVAIIRRQREERHGPLGSLLADSSASVQVGTQLNPVSGVANEPHAA